jgi:hypothetical protein
MKKPIMNLMHQTNHLIHNVPRFLVLVTIFLILAGTQAQAQEEFPVIKIRLTNPSYDCKTRLYCLDVEFLGDAAEQQVFGVNLRLFYDDDVLEYHSMGDFVEGYDVSVEPDLVTGPSESGAVFGLSGPVEWFNGSIEKLGFSSVYLSTTEWTKLFNICFRVDDVSVLLPSFCPPIIFDLQEDPLLGGYFPGDDGVVITLASPDPSISLPTTENVVQYNWEYVLTEVSYGQPVETDCIVPDYCVPVSDWAIYLAIGLMLAGTVFIYRRRISG